MKAKRSILPRLRRGLRPLQLPAKAAVSAVLAWLLASIVVGGHDDYLYYAPFGAVVATGVSVYGSLRDSAQTVAAIAVGALVAVAADMLLGISVLTIAVVVGGGMLLARLPVLGTSGSWAPSAALFVLIVGGSTPMDYVFSYAGLTALGAAVATVVNLLAPPAPIAGLEQADSRLRGALADQLHQLAEGLGKPEGFAPSATWAHSRAAVAPLVAEVRAVTFRTAEARRANPRSTRWSGVVDEQYRRARTMERLSFQVEQLTLLITEGERRGNRTLPLDQAVRPLTASALEGLAHLIRAGRDQNSASLGRQQVAHVHACIRELGSHLGRPGSGSSTPFQIAAVTVSLRRCLEVLAEERARNAQQAA